MGQPFVIPSVYTAVDKFSSPVKKMGDAVAGFVGRSERALNRANAAFSRLIAPITQINRMMMGLGVYVGLWTFLRIMRKTLDIFEEFQQAQVNIRAVTNNNIPMTKVLADQARDLALQYRQSASSILATDLALIKLGYTTENTQRAIQAIITGSVALQAEPEQLAKMVGASMMAFKMPAGSEQRIVDLYAKAADISALDWEELRTMLPIVQNTAQMSGESLTKVLALFIAVRNAQVHVSTGATGIKNMMVNSDLLGKSFDETIQKIIESPNKLKKAFKLFGRRSMVGALPIAEAQAIGDIERFMNILETKSQGYAEFVTNIRLQTFRGAKQLFSRAYEEFVLAIEDGNGSLAESLTRIVKVASAMLLLQAGTRQSSRALLKLGDDVRYTAERWLFWAKVIGYITAALISARIALWAWRGALIIASALQGIWNVSLGISAALGWTNVWALRGNIVALSALRVATWLAVAANKAWNATMLAGPLALIAAGVAGLIYLHKAYNQELKESQERLADIATKKGKQFTPHESSIWEEIGYRFFGQRRSIGSMEAGSDSTKVEKINPKAGENEQLMDSLRSEMMKGFLNININDPGKMVKDIQSDSSWLQPKVTGTNGWNN